MQNMTLVMLSCDTCHVGYDDVTPHGVTLELVFTEESQILIALLRSNKAMAQVRKLAGIADPGHTKEACDEHTPR